MTQAESGSTHAPVLEAAWRRFAELDLQALRLSKQFTNLRRWVAVFGVLATLIAILIEAYGENLTSGALILLKIFLVGVPLTASGLAAYSTRRLGDGRWLAMRAGAEEILKEIYIYRTVLTDFAQRNRWLSKRLAAIQRQVFKNSNNRLDTRAYKGAIPPYYNTEDPSSDPGFADINGDQYLRYRVEDQLNWHDGRLIRLRRESRNLTIAILTMGALGAALAGLGTLFDGLTIWVALTAAITTALTGWEELRSLDTTITNYSKVKLELNIVRDHWLSLMPAERTQSEFCRMVRATEDLLWAQNSEYIKSMQEALASIRDEETDGVEAMARRSEASASRTDYLPETADLDLETAESYATVVEETEVSVRQVVNTVVEEAEIGSELAPESLPRQADGARTFANDRPERAAIEMGEAQEPDGEDAEADLADADKSKSADLMDGSGLDLAAEMDADGEAVDQDSA